MGTKESTAKPSFEEGSLAVQVPLERGSPSAFKDEVMILAIINLYCYNKEQTNSHQFFYITSLECGKAHKQTA